MSAFRPADIGRHRRATLGAGARPSAHDAQVTARGVRCGASLAAVAALGLVLTACSPSHPGAAAVVGDTRISVAELQAALARTQADPAAASAVAAVAASAQPTPGSSVGAVTQEQRDQLNQLIFYALVVDAAKQQNITATPGDIAALLSSAEKSLGGQSQLNAQLEQDGVAVSKADQSDTTQFVQDLVLEQKLEAALAKNGSISEVHAAHIPVGTKTLADKILAEVKADPSKFAALAKQYSVDTGTAATGGDLGTQPRGSFPEPLDTDVNTKPVGSYFEVYVQSSYDVVHVISRGPVKLSSLDPTSSTYQGVLQDAFSLSLKAEAKKQGVTVNPRYGSWDADVNEITGASNVLSSPGAVAVSAPAAAPAASPAVPPSS